MNAIYKKIFFKSPVHRSNCGGKYRDCEGNLVQCSSYEDYINRWPCNPLGCECDPQFGIPIVHECANSSECCSPWELSEGPLCGPNAINVSDGCPDGEAHAERECGVTGGAADLTITEYACSGSVTGKVAPGFEAYPDECSYECEWGAGGGSQPQGEGENWNYCVNSGEDHDDETGLFADTEYTFVEYGACEDHPDKKCQVFCCPDWCVP